MLLQKLCNLIKINIYFFLQQTQCCCRSCVTYLMKNKLNEIIMWRNRLEGCNQTEAQQIVAEVLLASR